MYVNGSTELFKLRGSCVEEMLVSHFKSDQSSVEFKANQKLFCVVLAVFNQNNGLILSVICLGHLDIFFFKITSYFSPIMEK